MAADRRPVPRADIELAWAAGFFDGEGTITASRDGRAGESTGHSFMVAVKQSIGELDGLVMSRG